MTRESNAPAPGKGDGRGESALPGRKSREEFSTTRKLAKAEPPSGRDDATSSEAGTAQGRVPETGKTGETGGMTNAEFIAAIVGDRLPAGVFAAVSTITGDPESSSYIPHRWSPDEDVNPTGELNAYFNCGAFTYGKDGSFKARKDCCAGVLFLMLDDVGTKVPFERLNGVTPTWLIETSPGNFQVGLAFEELADGDTASRIHEAMIAAELCDEGARQPKNRWARLPRAINGKPKHERDGRRWQCRLTEWNPDVRFTPDELVAAFDLKLPPAGGGKRRARKARTSAKLSDPVFTPSADENPVITALKIKGLYKTSLGEGKHDVTCPWVTEHTDAKDSGSAYFEPSDQYPMGGFKCQHSHGDRFSVGDLLEYLGVSHAAASGQAQIRVLPGELYRVVSASEELLASEGEYFQRGAPAHIVRVVQRDGGASITVCSEEGLLLALSKGARWERWDARSEEWAVCDPPPRHVKALWRGGKLVRLLPLEGLARQAFFAPDGALVRKPGYHASSKRFGVFDAADFVFPADFNRAAAEQALSLLQGLLDEFAFVTEHDRAAAIAALLTAAARSSLPVAPAIHIRAPEYGSGKSYLADLIALFAAPTSQDIAKMSYPGSTDEATKSILAVLLLGPAAICFDDMAADWTPFGAVNRLITAEWFSDRVLQESRIGSASTRVLVMGTGNNVGPVGDLLRRVNVIHLDHGEERPATKAYAGDPVRDVTRARGRYVSAALTIIAAYRAAGSPKTDCSTLAGFGEWTDACRQPLLWLGLPDPAARMFENMQADPGRDTVGVLFEVWYKTFGDAPTTVRAAIRRAAHSAELFEAFDDMGVVERDEVNSKRLGWALKKGEGRIARGLTLTPAAADGRKAWKVAQVEAQHAKPTPVSPLSPVSTPKPEALSESDDDIAYASGRHNSTGYAL